VTARVTARVTGSVLLILGAALAVLPALTWFTAPPSATPTDASGFAGAGQLWLLPFLGGAIVLAGVGLAASRPGAACAVARWAGLLALVAGLLALGFAVWAGTDPSVTLRVTADGVTETAPAAIELAPAAIATPVVAGIACAIGASAAWVGWRR